MRRAGTDCQFDLPWIGQVGLTWNCFSPSESFSPLPNLFIACEQVQPFSVASGLPGRRSDFFLFLLMHKFLWHRISLRTGRNQVLRLLGGDKDFFDLLSEFLCRIIQSIFGPPCLSPRQWPN